MDGIPSELKDHHLIIAQYQRYTVMLVSALMAVVILLCWVGFYVWSAKTNTSRLMESVADVEKSWNTLLRKDAEVLLTASRFLIADSDLATAFVSGDKQAAVPLAQRVFARLIADSGVSNLNILAPDRAPFIELAANGPDDVAERLTLQQAAHDNRPFWGVEHGAAGTLSLRVAVPWFRDGQLIGYMELSKRFEGLMAEIQVLSGHDMLLFINKSFVDRQAWEANTGQSRLGATWDSFGDVVLTTQTRQDVPLDSMKRLAKEPVRIEDTPDISIAGRFYRLPTMAALDAANRKIGHLVVWIDETQRERSATETVGFIITVPVGVAMTIIMIFYVLLTKFEVMILVGEREKLALSELSLRDPLTKLYNRRGFDQILEKELALSHLTHSRVSLLMVDVDFFKKVNDTYGHQTGDDVLRAMGTLIRSSLRPSDIAARYGGEEFAVILPGVGKGAACRAAERLRQIIAEHPVELADNMVLPITVSIGVATFCDSVGVKEELINLADSALYEAKHAGRNRVMAAHQPEDDIDQTMQESAQQDEAGQAKTPETV
ncbi:MAG: diguanylate cyclase [Rhodospirillales bacterium]|nr:diguanylate cyclase [Rhodospirillales bacterium]